MNILSFYSTIQKHNLHILMNLNNLYSIHNDGVIYNLEN